MKRKEKTASNKRTMNLYFKADRTTKPATAMLYILFILAVILGFSKILVFDLWMEVSAARTTYNDTLSLLEEIQKELSDYDEIKVKYQRYSSTDEEIALIDRLEILNLLDTVVRPAARMGTYSISGETVQVQIDRLTLAEVAQISQQLEKSPIVKSTLVSTAATTGMDEDLVSTSIQIQLQKEEKK